MDIPFPQIMEETIEVVQIIPQEFVQNRTVEQIVVETGAGETVQKTLEVIQLVPQERIQERITHKEHSPNDVVGKVPSAKLQRRVSSEDCRTPFRGQLQ